MVYEKQSTPNDRHRDSGTAAPTKPLNPTRPSSPTSPSARADPSVRPHGNTTATPQQPGNAIGGEEPSRRRARASRGLKGGKARAEKLSAKKRSPSRNKGLGHAGGGYSTVPFSTIPNCESNKSGSSNVLQRRARIEDHDLPERLADQRPQVERINTREPDLVLVLVLECHSDAVASVAPEDTNPVIA